VAFDNHSEIRQYHGEKSYQIFKSIDDPNHLYLVFMWENGKSVQKYFSSTVFKDAMRTAGVLEIPDIHIIEEIARGRNPDILE
jgi:quinol monooxygenase YgiN